MFKLTYSNMSFDKGLQIIQADVLLQIHGEVLIDEPLCIDVGMPALVFSTFNDVLPNRYAEADEWSRIPFFVCGCGDPECRGYSFIVKHLSSEELRWIEVEQSEDGSLREMEDYKISLKQYKEQILLAGQQFLDFTQGLDYQPYFQETLQVVNKWVNRLAADSYSNPKS
jgi:hypothetical protein